jgi:ATP phosphoribosyltransferase
VIRIALPTGDLRKQTAAMLDSVGAGIEPYASGSRELRFPMPDENAIARVFRERDIPVQVALGNYDIGICSLTWIEELAQRFPSHDVVRLCDLGYGAQSLWLAAAGETTDPSVRIVSEYPNVAGTLARHMRLRRYRIFPVWGAAEAYPPEDADLALIAAENAAEIEAHGLRPLARVLDSSAWLIANRRSLASKDLSAVLPRMLSAGKETSSPQIVAPRTLELREQAVTRNAGMLRLALPDGHAQSHTIAALRSAGLRVPGYEDGTVVRRPRIEVDRVEVKVIRPQDMPQQVAIGQFDLAVTGRDWLLDHVVQFPSSPVHEVVDLKRSRYGLAAIVKDVSSDTVAGALAEWRARSDAPIRVASEYPNIADHFARARHIGRYSVIPIAGASEGFVPEDAEILIEGIDTGASLRANKLTILERFFESTNCVIARKEPPRGDLRSVYDALVAAFRTGADEPVAAANSAGGA